MINLKQAYMKTILTILSILLIACSNNESRIEAAHEGDPHGISTNVNNALQLNNGAKWKTDEATRENVAAMMKVVNENSNIGEKNASRLAKQLQARIDTLIHQCEMKGPEHDTLPVWLGQVLHNPRELKEVDHDEYQKSYAALRKRMESFYTYFE